MKLASLAMAAPLLVVSASAQAVRNPDYRLDERPLETAQGSPARTMRPSSWRTPVIAQVAWDKFLAAHGSWRAMWDGGTDVPTRIFGEGIEVRGAIADPVIAAKAARRLLAQHLELLAPGTAVDDFVPAANLVHADGTMRTVSFFQTWRGVRVAGGAVSFLFKNDRLFVIGSQALPSVSARLPSTTIDAAEAGSAAKAWIASLYAGDPQVLEVGEPVVLPVIRSRAVSYQLTVPVTVDLAEPRGRWVVHVDAGTAAPVARAQQLRFADGTLRYRVPRRYTGGEYDSVAALFASHLINNSAVIANLAGTFSWTGGAAATVTARVIGPFVAVDNAAGAEVTGSFTVQPGGEAVWDVSSTERSDAQLSAFVHANLIKQFAVTTLAPAEAWLGQRLSVSVNESGNCNAYSTGDDIHFYVQSAQCNNTARLADVVYHEFGHSLHAHAIIPGAGEWDGHLGEGVADYLAATYTNDAAMGLGFFRNAEPLRHLDPSNREYSYPDDMGAVHDSGLIIGGALWDLRKALIGALGAEAGQALADDLYYAVIERASDIPTSYPEALARDDDDGDLANGTPHKCLIDAAFAAHGLADAGGVTGGSIDPPAIEALTVTLTPSLGEGVCPPPAVASARATWRLRADAATTGTVDFVAGAADLTAELPDQPDGTVVQYQVAVTFADGTTQTFPKNPADDWYETYVGPVTVLACFDFEADPSAAGWTLGDGFAWGAPMATANASDPSAAHSGASVIGTDLGEAGGDGDYAANVELLASSPAIAIEVGAWEGVRLQYRRWLHVEDAAFDHATISVDGASAWQNRQTAAEDTHHRDREWRFHDVDVTAAAADGTVQIGFALDSDGGLELGGWTIDDVCIVALGAGRCGDGLVTPPAEDCDDGNDTAGDGCDPDCRDEEPAGPDAGPGDNPGDPDDDGDPVGGCCSTGSGGAGPLGLGLAVAMLLSRRHRRRVESGDAAPRPGRVLAGRRLRG